jgi:alkanesulfonate monooxygenase SsuD/methylene tetrahydromethanopterin reductase-like flavin-dependent oxidoreductase (luciferase family)
MDATVPSSATPLLGGPNKFKLAVFGANVLRGCSMTTVDGTLKVEWEESKRVAQLAEEAGIEGFIPVARWKGIEGDSNFNGRSFETFTWASGLAAVTERIQIFATFHVPTVHPMRGAKEVATVDHIAGGRFGLNLVAGWNEAEFRMFGIEQRPHDERYAVADEWLTVAKRLWAGEEFDFEGKYYTVSGGLSDPRPVQTPHPTIMSAGASPAGREFAAKHADIHFVNLAKKEDAESTARELKENARKAYGRDISVMAMAHIVCRDTEQEAKRYFDYYVHEKGDWKGIEAMTAGLKKGANLSQDYAVKQMQIQMIAGYSAIPLVGTAEQVAEGLKELSDAGLDGVTVSWVDYEEGLTQFKDEIAPLLAQTGVRTG